MSLEALTTEALAAIAAAEDLAALDQVRVLFTGKKATCRTIESTGKNGSRATQSARCGHSCCT